MATLELTLKELFVIVIRSTWSLKHRDRDEVMQSLCNHLDEKMNIPLPELRAVMSELGQPMREYCQECNEVIEEEGLCKTCEESHPFVRTCPSCQNTIHASLDASFEKDSMYYCSKCK